MPYGPTSVSSASLGTVATAGLIPWPLRERAAVTGPCPTAWESAAAAVRSSSASSAPAPDSRYRWRAGRRRVRPPGGLRLTALVQPHQDRVDGAGLQIELLAQVVAVPPAGPRVGQGQHHGDGLGGGAASARHVSDLYLDGLAAKDGDGETETSRAGWGSWARLRATSAPIAAARSIDNSGRRRSSTAAWALGRTASSVVRYPARRSAQTTASETPTAYEATNAASSTRLPPWRPSRNERWQCDRKGRDEHDDSDPGCLDQLDPGASSASEARDAAFVPTAARPAAQATIHITPCSPRRSADAVQSSTKRRRSPRSSTLASSARIVTPRRGRRRAVRRSRSGGAGPTRPARVGWSALRAPSAAPTTGQGNANSRLAENRSKGTRRSPRPRFQPEVYEPGSAR